jgi:hypothetical protein
MYDKTTLRKPAGSDGRKAISQRFIWSDSRSGFDWLYPSKQRKVMKLSSSVAFICVIGLSTCKSLPVSSTNTAVEATHAKQANDSLPPYQRVAKDKLTSPIRYQFNNSHNLVLCLHEKEPTFANHMMHPVSYLVYDVKNDRIIYEAQLANGYVAWHNDTQLKVSPILEAGSRDSHTPYVFDLPSKRRVNNNEVAR